MNAAGVVLRGCLTVLALDRLRFCVTGQQRDGEQLINGGIDTAPAQLSGILDMMLGRAPQAARTTLGKPLSDAAAHIPPERALLQQHWTKPPDSSRSYPCKKCQRTRR
jgi:hypothetical protein